MNLPPEPPHLTAVQAMRWREAARTLTESANVDINRLDEAGRILAMDRLRGALQDVLHLIGENPQAPPRVE